MTLNIEENKEGRIIVEVDIDLEELIPGYLQNRQNDIEAIREALSGEDFESIQRMGHTMKGSGGGYGFDFISAVGLHLEEGANETSVEKIQDALKNLCDFLERVDVVYK